MSNSRDNARNPSGWQQHHSVSSSGTNGTDDSSGSAWSDESASDDDDSSNSASSAVGAISSIDVRTASSAVPNLGDTEVALNAVTDSPDPVLEGSALLAAAPEPPTGGAIAAQEALSPAPAAAAVPTLSTIYSQSPGPSLDATGAEVREALNATNLSVTGAGVTVGVISDSFNSKDLAAADLGYGGVLPQQSDVTILNDFTETNGDTGQELGDDEGRAMMQVVHDVAPGANLDFCTSLGTAQDFTNGIEGSDQAFADAILGLANAGCKVICDDVALSGLPWFQSGVVDQAIQTVEQEGVVYIDAAGNERAAPNQTSTTATITDDPAYQSAWTSTSASLEFYPTTENFSDALEFANGTAYDPVTLAAGASVTFQMQWSEPWGAATDNIALIVSAETAENTFEVLDEEDENKYYYAAFERGDNVSPAGESTNLQDDPYVDQEENASISGTNLFPDFVNDTGKAETIYISIVNITGSNNPSLVKVIGTSGTGGNPPGAILIAGSNAGTSVGHQESPDGMAIGAVDSGNTPAFGNSPPLSEYFSSSDEGDEWLFGSSGTSLSSPQQLSSIAVSGVDDINASDEVGGTDYNPNFDDFYGTSAATPTVAAVIALMLQENPNLTPQQITTDLEESAISMDDTSVAGSGLVDAAAALQLALPSVWASAVSGNFAVATNWTPATVPGPSSNVEINPSGTYTVTTAANEVIDSLSTAAGATLDITSGIFAVTSDTASATNAGTIKVEAGAVLALEGTVNNNGAIEALRGTIELSGSVTGSGSIIVSSGGAFEVFGATSWTGLFLQTGANFEVGSDTEITSYSVSSGLILEVASAGTAISPKINSGGTELVLSGGSDTGATVSKGGDQIVYGTAHGATVASGGVGYVESGGVASGMTVDGLAYIEHGGTGSNTTVSSGGELIVYGLMTGGTVGSDTRDYVQSGGIAESVTVAGTGYVETGGSASETTIGSGGLFAMYGKATATTIKSTGREAVEVGGTDSNATVSSGGSQLVYGSAVSATIMSGGFGYVESGGVASGMIVGTGADAYVEHGGTDSNATVSSGGTRVGYGLTTGGTVDSGARDYVESGGIADSMAVAGAAYVEVGGSASGTTVSSGGVVAMYAKATATNIIGHEAVEAGGTDSNAVVSSGGTQLVYGSAVSTTLLSDGIAEVESGGIATGMIISSGGRGYVESGGKDSGATVSSGGLDDVLAGGSELGLTVGVGGTAVLSSGAVVNGTLYASGSGGTIDIFSVVVGGGTAEIGNGIVDIEGLSSENISFTSSGSGGLLLADHAGSATAYSGKITGFGGSNHSNHTQYIELADVISNASVSLSYTSSGAGNSSGTLAVISGGTTVADITFIGSYASTNFQLGSGAGDTVKITDPAASLQAGFAAASTLDYSQAATTNAGPPGDDGQFAKLGLFSQFAAIQFASFSHADNTIGTAPAASGSTALLVHGHG